MNNIFLSTIMIILTITTFTSCSKDGYYDRANKAADKAHYRLSKD